MADQSPEKTEASAPVTEAQEAPKIETKPDQPELGASDDAKPQKPSEADDAIAKKDDEDKKKDNETPTADADVKMQEADESATADADQSTMTVATTPKTPARRKSGGAAANRKSLSKKASKARITHLDAKPGDHFLVKLKGFPEWPAVICDESMLPHALITSRPVTAARPDGTYAEPYADGGKRASDRNFPVMYLSTNEFGWVLNTSLTELTAELAESSLNKGKLRKELRAAFELAVEQHPLDFYKDILKKFEEETIKAQEAYEAAAATPKQSKKSKAKAVAAADEDEDMPDATESTKKTKKRKAEEDVSTPQRPDSVKKPKIKLNTSSTPKTANGNGNGTPQPKDASAKASKPKPKKTKDGADKKAEAKEKMTPEERHARKEKEVLYLRHKLQRGLLTGEQTPKADDMPQMSDYITMLENFSGLEVSIIRATKINKVLKAILKLDSVPREEEFEFKSRSQKLLEKWNKLMAGETAPAATNGVNGTTESHKGEKDGKKKTDEETPAKETSPKETLEPAEKSVELEAKKPEEAAVVAEATEA